MEPVLTPITHKDGTHTSLRHFIPQEDKGTVLLMFPAMGVTASYYDALGGALAEKGIHVFAVDLRGNGHSSIRPSRKLNFGYADQLNHEYTDSVQHVREHFPDHKLLLSGHSLGGQLACLYASRATHRIDGLLLVASCSVYYGGYTGMAAVRTLLGTQFLFLVSATLGYLPGKQVGFGGLEARGVISDWSRQARTGRYRLNGDPVDYEQTLAELQLPILAVSIAGDDLAPPSAVDHLLGKMSSAQIEHLHLKKDDPRNDGYNHFNWARKPEKMLGIVTDWAASL